MYSKGRSYCTPAVRGILGFCSYVSGQSLEHLITLYAPSEDPSSRIPEVGQSIHHGGPERRQAQRLTRAVSGDRASFPRGSRGDPKPSMEDDAGFFAWIVQCEFVFPLDCINFCDISTMLHMVVLNAFKTFKSK